MKKLYHLGLLWHKVAYKLLGNMTVEGVSNVPMKGPLLIISNHQSNADPPLIAASMPRDVAFLAKESLFRGPVVSYIFRSFGMYPVSQTQANYSSTKWAFTILDQNQSLCIFPESKRNIKGMQKGALGAAFLAIKTNASILPVGITGSENISSILRIPFPFCKIAVRIGEPFRLPAQDSNPSKVQLRELTDMMMRRVSQLLPEGYRGYYKLSQDKITDQV